MELPHDFTQEVQQVWQRFLQRTEPLRPDLHRYCCALTGSVWDAEDLVQDTLLRAFAKLGDISLRIDNPKAYLFRIASNLWVDHCRRTAEVMPADRSMASNPEQSMEIRDAAKQLLLRLSPQERAAVVLKDAFDFSLEETSEALGTTVGAVKAALHRARGKLLAEPESEAPLEPAPAALDAFCSAFNAGDLEALTSLLLDSAVVEVVGATTQYGPEAARRTVLYGMLFGSRLLADPHSNIGIDLSYRQGTLPDLPRVEARFHRGRWILLHWYKHQDGEAVRAFTTIELDRARIARLRNYFYTADFIVDLAGELGVPARVNGQRWWREAPSQPEPGSSTSG